jgi:succinoglycan biosynthesis protein ExoA
MQLTPVSSVCDLTLSQPQIRCPPLPEVETIPSDLARVLVVVPCLNEEQALPFLLTQLLDDNASTLIIVADGGSTDRSLAIVADFAERHDRIHLVDNPKRLQSAGVNAAVKAFAKDHDWLVRVDAHCSYPNRYVQRLLDAARRHGADTVVVPMVTQGTTCFQIAAAAAQNSVLGTGGSAHRHVGKGRFVDHGHHALFRLESFRRVGGYDESFSHNEDAELDQRLLANACKIWLEPDAALIYAPRSAPVALFRQYFNYGRGRARTVRKHGLRLKLRQSAPLLIAPAIIMAVAGVAAAFAQPLLLVIAVPALAWFGLCQAFGLVIAARTGSLCSIFSGTAAAIMHAGWSFGYWRNVSKPAA